MKNMGSASTTPTPPVKPVLPGRDDGEGAVVVEKQEQKVEPPKLYQVVMLNDDFTPMEFVVLVLQDVFNKTREEAMRIMLHVHNQGVGECGVFPFEVAETKVTRVMDAARKNQHPLQCVMEKQ
jgi:ATP-dependent Clp protease adaptor protein ClpS